MVFILFLLSCSNPFDSRSILKRSFEMVEKSLNKESGFSIDWDDVTSIPLSEGTIEMSDLFEIWDNVAKFHSNLFNKVSFKLKEIENRGRKQALLDVVLKKDDKDTKELLFEDVARIERDESKRGTIEKRVYNSLLAPLCYGENKLVFINNSLETKARGFAEFDSRFFEQVYESASEKQMKGIKETLGNYCYRYKVILIDEGAHLKFKFYLQVKKKGTPISSLILLGEGEL